MRIKVSLAVMVALLAAAPASSALKYGVADDFGKYAGDSGAQFFSTLRSVGMTENRMTVLWRTGMLAPDAAETAFLDRSILQAQASGVEIVLSVYPGAATEHDPGQFCLFARGLAQRYPYVREMIIGNEPNKADFWSPVDPAAYLQLLAACYDLLKPLGVTVIGGATSARKVGNGMSPVEFILGLGGAYRASGRTAPVMDLLSHHPYPNPERIQLGAEAGYDWPNAGIPDLNRMKQAVEDAFKGSGQATFTSTLKFKLDEVGWQSKILAQHAALYSGAENSVTVEEAQQAEYYRQLIAKISCDVHVAELLLFHLIDERELNASGVSGGWQSGLLRIDLSVRPSFDSVKAAIAAACTGGGSSWSPATGVVGGQFSVSKQRLTTKRKGKPLTRLTGNATFEEGVRWSFVIKQGTKVLLSRGGTTVTNARNIFLGKLPVIPGSYVAQLVAEPSANAARKQTFTQSVSVP